MAMHMGAGDAGRIGKMSGAPASKTNEPVASDAAHERLIAALNASRCGTWRWEIAADSVEWDDALSRIYGLSPAQAPRNSREFMALVHPEDRPAVTEVLARCLAQGSELEYEFRVVVGDTIKWIYDRSSVVRDPQGRPLYMTGACLDVTARKQVEQECKAALERQKLLLEELNHRIKNHLQLVIGMLQLKARRQENASARADFESTIQRVHTIADLHARLYQDDRVGAVEMDRYLQDICESLRRSIIPDARIVLECQTEPVLLSADLAMPLGLIVNELVTNAAKYAFPDGRSGRIRVRLHARGERIILSVADNGCGLSGPARHAGAGIGMRMVKALARQIGARSRITTARGLACYLSFRRPVDADRAQPPLRSASTPGSGLPSSHSRNAPPAVET